VQDRSRALGRRLRAISRTMGRRTGERKAQVLALTEQAGELLLRSVREARRLALVARARSRGRGAQRKLNAIETLEELADRAERITTQIDLRIAGKPVPDRLVSMFDPDARPIRKGKLGEPNEFGYVAQICEVTQNTRRGARGFILPASIKLGNPPENNLLPDTASELQRLGLKPREVALDGGFQHGPTDEALRELNPDRVFIAGRKQPGSRRTQRRLGRYRTGAEGRISHLKRSYGLRRSRLKGQAGVRTWTAWGILAYNLDTLAIRAD
jgi:IS5 family transposase